MCLPPISQGVSYFFSASRFDVSVSEESHAIQRSSFYLKLVGVGLAISFASD